MVGLLLVICLLVSVQSDWIERASMPTARSDMYANTVGSYMYVIGGCIVSQATFGASGCPNLTNVNEIYDPIQDTWSTGAPALTARYRHSTAVVGNKIYVISGRDGQDNVITTTEIFDTSSGTWTFGPALPEIGQTSDGYAYSSGSVLYYTGGYFQNYTSSPYVLSLDTSSGSQTWTLESNQLRTARGDHAISVVDGIPYLFGGFNSDQGFCQPLQSTEAYENGWIAKSDMKTARGDAAEALVTVDGKTRFFVVGGETVIPGCTGPLPILEVESYDPASDTWTLETPLPGSVMRFAGDGYGSTVFIFGGQREGVIGDGLFEVYSTVYSLEANPTGNAVGGRSGIMAALTIFLIVAVFN